MFLKGAENPALTNGANLRIMSFNILAELWHPKARETFEGRTTQVADVIRHFSPDVAGIQEATPRWHNAIKTLLGDTYAIASGEVYEGVTNYSTIIYNTATTELIECESVLFSIGNSGNMRNLTWARMRRKSDGAEYIVTCTHWDIVPEMREVQWEENVTLIKDIFEKYNLPIFATGDYNTTEEGFFKDFLERTQFTDPKFTAKVVEKTCKTVHPLGEMPIDDVGLCIDHIAVAGKCEVLYYNVSVNETTINASDHFPIYIDVKI